MNLVSTSVMCMDMLHLQDQITLLDNAGTDFYHIDIMDGRYVPNFALNTEMMKAIRSISSTPMDVHMMVSDPDSYLGVMAEAGASIIIPHLETMLHPIRTLQRIHALGVRAGVAISPATDLSPIRYLLDDLDMVCMMTVNPGFAGQKLVPVVIGKTAELKKMIDDAQRSIDIMVDGNINPETASALAKAGASTFVLGSSGLFKYPAEKYAKVLNYYHTL